MSLLDDEKSTQPAPDDHDDEQTITITPPVSTSVSATNTNINTVISTTKEKLSPPPSDISIAEKIYVFVKGILMGIFGPLLPGDTPNRLKLVDPTVPGLERTCSFGEKISLAKVKEIKNKFKGTTVNDILSAVLNMTVRRYYEAECTSFLDSRPLVRALFPINMRQKGADVNTNGSLGNCFSTGVFQFLFDYSSRIDLVWKVKRQVDLIKISPQVRVRMLHCIFVYGRGQLRMLDSLTISCCCINLSSYVYVAARRIALPPKSFPTYVWKSHHRSHSINVWKVHNVSSLYC